MSEQVNQSETGQVFESAEDYLVKKQGVPSIVIKQWQDEGFRHTTMICPDLGEQMEYEKALKAGHKPEDIKMYPLSGGGGRAYWIRESKK